LSVVPLMRLVFRIESRAVQNTAQKDQSKKVRSQESEVKIKNF